MQKSTCTVKRTRYSVFSSTTLFKYKYTEMVLSSHGSTQFIYHIKKNWRINASILEPWIYHCRTQKKSSQRMSVPYKIVKSARLEPSFKMSHSKSKTSCHNARMCRKAGCICSYLCTSAPCRKLINILHKTILQNSIE